MENKLTDNEIIKALECCITADSIADCMKLKCPMHTRYGCTYYLNTDDDDEHTICREQFKSALDLINRQKAEIERLDKRIAGQKHALFEQQSYTAELQNELKTAKAEAIKATILEIDNRLSHYGKCDELHKYEVSDVLVEVEEAMVGEQDV